jgi:hypothetical protein
LRISGPAETPSDWVTTSTPVSARSSVGISSASPCARSRPYVTLGGVTLASVRFRATGRSAQGCGF